MVITEDVKTGERRLRKGHRLGADDASLLASAYRPVHAVVLDAGDVHEDEAGRRLATAAAGPGLEVRGPAFSRYNLVAAAKACCESTRTRCCGLIVCRGRDFHVEDRLPVVPGKIVTGVKVTPVAVTEVGAVLELADDERDLGPAVRAQREPTHLRQALGIVMAITRPVTGEVTGVATVGVVTDGPHAMTPVASRRPSAAATKPARGSRMITPAPARSRCCRA